MHFNSDIRLSAFALLKRFYGYDSFRPMQYEIIEHTMQGLDSLVLMPTGGGKSICFQIPALMSDGCAIVVSPLLALMKDQVDVLRSNGIPAAAVNSMQTDTTNRDVLEKVFAKKIKLLYISPERLLAEVDKWSTNLKISLIAIDEAHCISQWGHDFRPEYTKLSSLKEKFPSVPIMALTATADKLTRDDIVKQLGIVNSKMFLSSFDRPNLSLSVVSNATRAQKEDAIFDFLDEHQHQSGIIYCLSRATTESVTTMLQKEGYKAECYHAGLRTDVRQAVQQRFLNDETQIICATIAFGMGIDKSNIRWVIHYNMPKNLECYYQEIGRAGRDGMPSDTLMFYSYGDVATLSHFVEESGQIGINREKLQRMQEYAEANICRRRILLSYFNERFDYNCNNCDVCRNPREMIDGTTMAQMALSAIARMKESEPQPTVIDVLKGVTRPNIVANDYQKLKTFGVGAQLSYRLWSGYMLQMHQLGLIEIDYSNDNNLKITQYGWDVLRGKCNVQLAKVSTEYWQKKSNGTKPTIKNALIPRTVEEKIIEELKKFRFAESKKIDIATHIILSDKTISEIALAKPMSFAELSRMSGLGDVKLANYGRQIIGIVRRAKGLTATVAGLSEDLTYFLVDKDYGIDSIAQIKKCKPITIASQIAKGIQLGKISSARYRDFISQSDYDRIVKRYLNGEFKGISDSKENPNAVVIALAIYRKNNPNIKIK